MAIKPNTDEGAVVALTLHETITRITEGDHYYMLTSGNGPAYNTEWCFEASDVNAARRKARAAGFSSFWLMSLDGGSVQLTC